MFVVNRNPVDKTTFMSYDKFEVQWFYLFDVVIKFTWIIYKKSLLKM